MKIAFITQYFHPEQFSNNSIAQELVQRGHEVHVVCCVPNYPAGTFFKGYSNSERREEVWEGVHIHRTRTIARGTAAWQLALNYLVFPFAAIWTLLRKVPGRADVSFVSMPSPLTQALAGVMLRWFKGTPTVYWVQDIWPESATHTLGIRNPFILRPLSWFCGWLYRRADLVLVQSDGFPPMITRYGVPDDHIRVFPDTAPPGYEPIPPEDAPDEAEIVGTDGFCLMFAGNIGQSQDFDTLIATAERLADREDLTWMIVGSGRDMARAQGEIGARGLEDRFRFVGRYPPERMPAFFAHADAMVVSLKDGPMLQVVLPYKVQCYMACGKPIIASLNGEGARIIEEAGAGPAVPASSPDQLAEAIRGLLDAPPEVLAEYGQRSRAYFEANFAADTIFDNLEAWLTEVALAAPSKR